MLDTMLDEMLGAMHDEAMTNDESALFAAVGLPASDLLLAPAYDNSHCGELVHADIRATLTRPWLRTLADFVR